ncbi:DUF2141 domain-containing protein [Thalassotalea sp. M1531]|uniref:DUF2141 domain-containing protein n=2 Tax=Thalassotalea algicola TaxID=2716224 RepID=A0A7Y0L915_9GAMM|nr:DUF2141 domain-containing protein [Thalassotalea algicola]
MADRVLAKEISFQIQGINQNVSDSQTKLYVQLFKGQENYQQGKPAAATIVSAKAEKVTVTFNDIETGEYALRFFHDENNNGQLETNLFGLPTEGYGFSNNAKPNFGPVSYDEIKFQVTENEEKVVNTTSVIY